LGHGALETTKKNEKKGEQALSLSNLGNGILEVVKKKKRKEKREQGPLLPKVCDGVAKVTKKKEKKGELSSSSIETW